MHLGEFKTFLPQIRKIVQHPPSTIFKHVHKILMYKNITESMYFLNTIHNSANRHLKRNTQNYCCKTVHGNHIQLKQQHDITKLCYHLIIIYIHPTTKH